MGTATGTRTPLPGLRARCLHLSTIAACGGGGSGATRTPKGLATPTCLRDRLAVSSGRLRRLRLLRRRSAEPPSPPAGSLPRAEGVGLAPTTGSTRARVANGFLIWPVPFRGALGGNRTHDLVRTGDALCLLSYKGLFSLASPARFERATSAFGGRRSAPLSYDEMASTAGVEPASPGFVGRCLVHWATSTYAPPTGFAPATSDLTGRRSSSLSYGGVVRALGLEPSLFRGKSPVPYQSGVTRWCTRDRRGAVPGRCLCSCQRAGARTGDPVLARPEGVEPPAVGVGDRDATVARAQEMFGRA